MFKNRSMRALMACALATAAFAVSAAPVSHSPPGFERADVVKVAKDVNPISLRGQALADSGAGAASALKAYERQTAPAVPAQRLVAADPDWELRVLAHNGGGSGCIHGGGSAGVGAGSGDCRMSRGPDDHEEEPDISLRRLLT